jgi:hypothetical protein
MSVAPDGPGAATLARLLAHHAPQARRFLAWQSGAVGAAGLLAAARSGTPDWVIALEPTPARLAPLIEALPADPCLHLRVPDGFEPLPPGRAHPVLIPHRQGLVPEVVLLGGPHPRHAALSVQHGVAPGGLVLLPDPGAEDRAALDAAFAVTAEEEGMLALRPRRAAPPPPARAPGRHGIIVTVVGAQAEAEWAITSPSVRAYAEAIGAELVVCRDGAGLPVPRLKAVCLPAAETFDRVILMDADILVRPGAPDLFAIVPPGSVGAYPEGRHFAREALAAEAAALHGAPPFPAEDYVNTGVMVLSRGQLGVLRVLGEGLVAGRIPDQDTQNVALHRLGLPLHRLGPEFNLMASGRHPADWRCGWMLHAAGAPKLRYQRRHAWWRDTTPGGDVLTARPLTGRSLRLPHMVAQASRIAGCPTVVLDPDDAALAAPHALPRMMPDGVAAIWLEPAGPDAPPWPVQGRLEGPFGGPWQLLAVPVPGVPLPDCAFALRLPAGEAPLATGRLRAEQVIDLPAGTDAVELALGGPGAGGALAGLVLAGQPVA